MASPGFKNNFGILMMVICGFVGISLGYIFIEGRSGESPFHEVRWRPREIIAGLLDSADNRIQKRGDSSITKEKIQLLRININKMSDSLLENVYFKKNISIEPDSVHDLATVKEGFVPARIKLTWYDTLLPEKKLETMVKLDRYNFNNSKYAFISRYPSFGLWALMLVLQFSFFLYLLPWIISAVFGKPSIEWPAATYKQHYVWYYFGIIVVCLAIMFFFIDPPGSPAFVLPAYFMEGLNTMFKKINFVGYFLTIICFTGCLKCAAQALAFSKTHNKATPYTDAEAGYIRSLKEEFKTYFGIVAIILSAAVFTTGTFFTGLNSLDFIRQITRSQGYSSLRYDFVYLYGLFHSFLLLLIWLPVNYIFKSLEPTPAAVAEVKSSEQKSGAATPDKPKSIRTSVGEAYKGLLEVAVAGSPILASLLQSILNYFFK